MNLVAYLGMTTEREATISNVCGVRHHQHSKNIVARATYWCISWLHDLVVARDDRAQAAILMSHAWRVFTGLYLLHYEYPFAYQ